MQKSMLTYEVESLTGQCVLVHACIEGPLDPGRTAQSSSFRTIDPSRVLAEPKVLHRLQSAAISSQLHKRKPRQKSAPRSG